jgi:hypothetical protein
MATRSRAARASLVLAPGAVPAGPHTIVVTVKTRRGLVRNDPNGVLRDAHLQIRRAGV